MPILESEVVPGVVALLDQQFLARHPSVRAKLNIETQGLVYGKDRPYVCLITARDWSAILAFMESHRKVAV